MPGFDGIGPRGQGPLSGQGRGFCMMRIPDDPGQDRSGYAGRNGQPVRVAADPRAAEMFALRSRLQGIRTEIQQIRSRLAGLDAGSGTNPPKRDGA